MEFPKMIYLGGDIAAEWRIVADEEEQAAAGKDGFYPHDLKSRPADEADVPADQPKRRGRPPKAAQ